MIRVLIIIAVASFVLAVACLSGAAAIGGRDLAKNGWNLSPAFLQALGEDGDVSIRVGGLDIEGPVATRDLAWTAGPSLQIDIPASVSYAQGSSPKVTVTGPQTLVDQVVIDGGRLRFRDTGKGFNVRHHRDRLEVTIVAPAVSRFVLNGSGSLSITDYDQPSLAIEINGSGDVSGVGKTAALKLAIMGSGDADLAQLQAGDASVRIAGSGEAVVSATGAARVDIAGSGDVSLATRPASLTSNIDGSGDLHVPE